MLKPAIEKVIESGVCVGCGACSIATKGKINLEINSLGFFQAQLGSAHTGELDLAGKVCPFSDDAVNEDQLTTELFSTAAPRDRRLGVVLATYAGRVSDQSEDIRLSSSGGMTSWLTLKLLESGTIDGVIHVAADRADIASPLFAYVVSTSADELRMRRKSQYYSTTLTNVIQHIRGDGKRYALVGVPCFIKAARLLAREDEVLRKQLAFFIGLVCGHLKSSGFAELLAWQTGVPPQTLSKVDFRVKVPEKSAGDYSFSAWNIGTPDPATRPTRSLLGGNWGHAMFQLKACDYCDDIFAETADIAFGDAWLPKYSKEWRGTNVIVSRNPALEAILQIGIDNAEIFLEPISPDDAAESQSGNYRHRWDGLSLRLADDLAAGVWAPRKRIAPGSRPVTKSRARIVRIRRELAALSHAAFFEAKAKGSLEHYKNRVEPLVSEMNKEYRAAEYGILRRIVRKIKRTWVSTFR